MINFAFKTVALATVALAGQSLFASTPGEVAALGLIAGRDLYRSKATSTQTGFKDQWERLVRIVGVRQPVFADADSEAIWEEARACAERALADLARIAQIDNNKPSDWNAVVSGLKAAFDDTKKKERTEYGEDFWIRVLAEVGKSALQSEFRDAESVLDAKLGALTEKVQTPYLSHAIGIGYLPSWQGAYNNDLLILKNETGRDLPSSAFFVRIQDKHGSYKTHIHRAWTWANNEEVRFQYPYYDSSYASGETVSVPNRVDVSVFSQDMVLQGMKTWSDEEYSDTIRQYLSDVHVSGLFLGEYSEDGSGTMYYPGVKFWVKGLNRLPVKRITVRFIRGADTQEVYWDWNQFVAPSDEGIPLRSEHFAAFGKSDPPQVKQIVLEFTDTSATAVYTL